MNTQDDKKKNFFQKLYITFFSPKANFESV